MDPISKTKIFGDQMWSQSMKIYLVKTLERFLRFFTKKRKWDISPSQIANVELATEIRKDRCKGQTSMKPAERKRENIWGEAQVSSWTQNDAVGYQEKTYPPYPWLLEKCLILS